MQAGHHRGTGNAGSVSPPSACRTASLASPPSPCITCSGLASLSRQLQQLDLTRSTILQPQQPDQPGAVTLDTLFSGARLQQLSLGVDEDGQPLPELQPVAPHLTPPPWKCPTAVPDAWWPHSHWGLLTQLLQALPRLHTLLLPEATVGGRQEMDALLAATQLTSVQLASVWCLHSSATQAPCSWQRLELSGCIDCYSAAYLPLHSLTQPRLVARLCVSAVGGSNQQMAAAVHNLTQAYKVPVEVKAVELDMLQTSLYLHQLVDTLQPQA
ncbi:hypothetical protein QJQ45_003734 [Haematococcus lacustris]|nr:hypothetical protein QJQ45_003734 [Haematococcus lacustris]